MSDSSAAALFERTFERSPHVVVSAPGRVNLLGEHTDYNDGLVLPTVIPQRTYVALARREDDVVNVATDTLGKRASFRLGQEHRVSDFIDYVQGVTAALREQAFRIGGFDAAIVSTVPVGGGLSSSAALEVALLRALDSAFALSISELSIARLARWGENNIVGAPVGILDPVACSLGEPGKALFIDTRTLDVRPIAIPVEVELVVVDSGVSHDHATGGYRTRKAECERACELLGLGSLRDLPNLESAADLPSPLRARVRHVFTENERVRQAVDALARGDCEGFGSLFWASHASMRDDYEVSVPPVDRIVEHARTHPAVLGARMTGGGFGGAVIALVRAGEGESVARHFMRLSGVRALVPAIGA